MAEFSDLGEHCSDPYCRQKDVLTRTCDGCGAAFCRQCITDHSCSRHLVKDKRVVLCDKCGTALPLVDSLTPQQALAAHECQPVQKKPRCAVCRTVLTFATMWACPKCDKKVCLRHRLPEDHMCAGIMGCAATARQNAAAAAEARARMLRVR
ncbi:unnamed protein product [Vitrella brassicaformis CCMP3155]|uniref:AN1-type domain-containing protein n=1 Tax=Vitrella brassicaformis (strain CCMP3155) TaxID=1169540 RepID=A0A0G4GIT7_VITBC|nr:unnamed protein product [Vitrella brassicaformis CCMP3155]|mmetsp:Transcript_24401/g.60228  ORF Transcript_24401/g.60228 Transcript_24401/m.60228 type:complete len:152 (-) Transcript_24401:559-1014(-)|eukprot:CEM29615.1 unnamed protein product [Vitrella brassicaformis CCMP3155]